MDVFKINVIENAKRIIQSLNIEITLEKQRDIDLFYEMELEKLLNYLNRDELPKRLTFTLANRVVGRFLYNSLTIGKYNEITNMSVDDLTQVVSLKEYETNIHYGKNEAAFDDRKKLITALNEMMEYNKEELHKYRKLIWT